LVLSPPKTRTDTVLWLALMFVVLAYPLLHVVKAVFKSKIVKTQPFLAMTALGGLTIGIGYHVWPPIRRHPPTTKERYKFEQPLTAQKEPREQIQITCDAGDESTCVYAAQFVNIFREAGWTVANNQVEPVRMNNPMSGIMLFKRGVGKLDPNNWQSGLWSGFTESLLNVRRAFVNIVIEPERAANPQISEGVVSVHFAMEREDESAPTNFTNEMKQLLDCHLGTTVGVPSI